MSPLVWFKHSKKNSCLSARLSASSLRIGNIGHNSNQPQVAITTKIKHLSSVLILNLLLAKAAMNAGVNNKEQTYVTYLMLTPNSCIRIVLPSIFVILSCISEQII